jgi:hypothetical protein
MKAPWIQTVLASALLFLLTGCVPELITWSPDGKQASVITPQGLCLCDAEGNLGRPLVRRVGQVQWLSDSKHAVIWKGEKAKTWKDYLTIRPNAERDLRDKALALRKEILAHPGPWTGNGFDDFIKTTLANLNIDEFDAGAIFVYIRDQAPEGIKEKVGDQWVQFEDAPATLNVVQVYELGKDLALAGPVLLRTSHDIKDIRVSPGGKTVAITVAPGIADDKAVEIFISPLTAGAVEDSHYVGKGAWYPDWSPDSKSLYYVKPVTSTEGGKAQFGTLVRQQIVGDDGKLLDHTKLPAEEDLVGVAYDPMMRVRALPDGRVFFDSVSLSLPATPMDVPDRGLIFAIAPGKQATVTRLVPRTTEEEIGDAAEFFAISPDGAYVAIPWKDGRIAVLDTATGSVSRIQPDEDKTGIDKGSNDWHLKTVPVWRSNDELCFIRPVGKERQVVLHSMRTNQDRVLSANWPLAAREEWLVAKPEPAETQPAGGATTAPATGPQHKPLIP